MKFARPLSLARIVWLAAALLLSGLSGDLPAQAPVPLDVQKYQQGLQLFTSGKYAEAAGFFEGIIKEHPTSGYVPEANFRLGFIHYLTGEYDKAVAAMQKNTAATAKNVPPEVAEGSLNMVPQILAAKAGKMEAGNPGRKAAFAEAIKQFDAFIAKYPQSEEVETANYGKARAHYQIQEFDAAAAALRANLQKFPQSPSVLDTQFMLALVLGTQANTAMQNAKAKAPAAEAAYDEALRLLGDIIQKRTDLALANDAQFQLGEVLFSRGSFAEKEQQQQLMRRGLGAYRAVQPKELVIKAQKDRLEAIVGMFKQAGASRDVAQLQRAQRLQLREQEKLALLEQREDQTLTAKMKSGQIFLTLQDFDAARVLFRFVEPFIEEAEQKKQVLYFITVSYAAQQIADKAVENYEKFKAAYKADPIAENLPVLIGSIFLGTETSDPDRAIKYFKEQAELYPTSKFTAEAVMSEALALIPLKRFDEALAVLKKFLSGTPTKEQAAAAEFGIATIHQQTNKIDEAIKAYKAVRDKHVGLPQAEQAAFYVAHLTLGSGDAKTALEEFKSFLTKFPDSELAPAAMLFQGQAEGATGQKDAAVKTYQSLAAKHPKAEAAMSAYFQRATLFQNDTNYAEAKKAMREYIEAYPEGEKLYAAYDYIAQMEVAEKALTDAIATYEEFAAKRADDPAAATALLKVSGLWKTYAEQVGLVYLNFTEEQRTEWRKGIEGSVGAAEKVLEKYPESPEVALALQSLLAAHRMQMSAKVKTEADVEQYFTGLAKKFDGKPTTKSKVLFALAGFLAEKDNAKAVGIMASAYDPSAVYAPADLDLYGMALVGQKKHDEAQKVFDKLAKDYPLLANVEPGKAPRNVWEAQSIWLFGSARILQEQGKGAEAQAKFEELKKTYPYSHKLLEADYGIAAGLFAQKKYDEALALLRAVAKRTDAPAPLRAKSMLLLGKLLEAQGKHEDAINNFIKIAFMFESVPDVAAEGLWLGAQMQEQQASGKLPMPVAATPAPKGAAKPASKSAAKADAKPAAEKKK